MNFKSLGLPGLILVNPDIYTDARGFFMETFNAKRYGKHGISENFVQDNFSSSKYGVVRGLHYQHPNGQGKLVQVTVGEVFDVVVDIRRGSPTFGQWLGVTLSEENKSQLWIPSGFAHGFCVTSEHAVFTYKCTEFYDPDSEKSIRWNDPKIGVEWPISDALLSPKDETAPLLSELDPSQLPEFC